MAKKPKFDTMALARVLKDRGLMALVFDNGIHMRLHYVGTTIDLWPTTGRWKWLNQSDTGTLEDFAAYLDAHPARIAEFNSVFDIRS
jgi:hypothetical protein